MAMELALNIPGLIGIIDGAKLSGTDMTDGSLHYTLLIGTVEMVPILRTGTELFTDTCTRVMGNFKVITNGNYYDVDLSVGAAAYASSDPIPASETRIEGQIIQQESLIAGRSAPDMFYFSQVVDGRPISRVGPPWFFRAGRGDPPLTGAISAVGGVGPLIINDLPYGVSNRFSGGTAGPAKGDPGPALAKSLIRRSNATFASVEDNPPQNGKTIIAYSEDHDAVLVAVQPDDTRPGQTYEAIGDALVLNGFSDAIFLDGSSSSFMVLDGTWLARPNAVKNETMTLGLGFTYTPRTP